MEGGGGGGATSAFHSVKLCIYSLPQRLEGNNESPVFVDFSSCVAAVAHRKVYSEVERIFSRSFLPLFRQFFSTQSFCGGD